MARIVVCPTTNGPVAVVIDGVSVEDIVGGDPFMLAYRVLTGANHYTDRKCVPRWASWRSKAILAAEGLLNVTVAFCFFICQFSICTASKNPSTQCLRVKFWGMGISTTISFQFQILDLSMEREEISDLFLRNYKSASMHEDNVTQNQEQTIFA